MAELTCAMTYGKALFEVAREQNQLDRIWDDLQDVYIVLKGNPDLQAFLDSPVIAEEDKIKEVREIFAGQVSETFLNFLCVLIEKGRTNQYARINREYKYLVDEYRRISFGKIYSAVPLTREQITRFEEETGRLLNQEVLLKNKVVPSLIGGVSIQVDGKIIDASVKSRLSAMAELLIKTEGGTEG